MPTQDGTEIEIADRIEDKCFKKEVTIIVADFRVVEQSSIETLINSGM